MKRGDMMTDNKELLFVLDFEKWQSLQDALAVVTDMAIITVDYKGVPVTKHSGCSEFCRRVRANEQLNTQCQKCDSRGGIEATRLQKPYIYLCHTGILDAAIPIIVNKNYLGAIMIGQVLLANEEDAFELETLCRPSDSLLSSQLTKEELALKDTLPRLSLGRVKTIVDMLFHLCSYIVEGAIEKSLALDMAADILGPPQFQGDLASYRVENLKNIRRKLDSAIINADMKAESQDLYERINPTLRPALQYMNTHKNERCSMSDMASLCHISPSYFSRLFLKEMGESYSSYLLHIRMKWAKELLGQTDKHINEIASAIGFSDAGHFVRTFKKYEGITPARFRKLGIS